MDTVPTQFGSNYSSSSSSTSAISEISSETFSSYRLDSIPEKFPFTHATTLMGPSKLVSCLHVDPPGVRCCVGALDHTLKLYDFAGMVQGKPFRSIEFPGLPMIDVTWSNTGDTFLVAPSNSEPKLYDRHGQFISEFAKGDMYIRDPRHTDGHTGTLTGIQWSPLEKNIFATSSADSTIRLWDIEHPRKQKQVIVFKYGSGARGNQAKAPVTTLSYSKDGAWLAGGCQDGSVRIWKSKGPFLLPPYQLPNAHTDALVSLQFSLDSYSILTRSLDDTIKQWDLRKLKSPLHTLSIPTTEHQNAIYSPNDETIALSSMNSFQIYSKSKMEKQSEYTSETPFTRVHWHDRFSQCFVGTKKGTTLCFFNVPETMSKKQGVVMNLDYKVQSKVDDLDEIILQRAEASTIIVPGAGGNQKTSFFNLSGKISKRQYEKMRQDPQATRMPERPKPQKALVGGVVGHEIIRSTLREEDPREALLKYAKEAEHDPYWIAPAYKQTQPKAVLAPTVIDEEEQSRVIVEEERQKGKRRKY